MAKIEINPWAKTTIGSFIATVLGIALTLGTSKLAEIKNNRAMQRQCVFNVLSDLNNAKKAFQKDSALVAELGEWLPDYMERHANNQEFPLDSAVVKFQGEDLYPSYLRSKYIPVGRNIMSAIVPANEDDMALHRTMELAYSYIDKIQGISDQLLELVEHMRQICVKYCYGTEGLNEKEFVELFMNDDQIKTLTDMIYNLDGLGAYGKYLKDLQTYYDTILKMSGITEKEYDAFMENVDKRQGR